MNVQQSGGKMNLLKEDYLNIKKWMYRNARPLDIERWKFHFEDGKVEDVLKVMEAYQNDDGGFGNALEADSWNPNSTPYTTSIAVRLLEEIDFTDKDHPIVLGMLKYLENTKDYTEGYWPAVVPTNNEYPHAPWWSFANQEGQEEWGYTPTAQLAGFILAYGDEKSELFMKACIIAETAFEKYLNGVNSKNEPYRDKCREGEIGCYQYLVKCIEKSDIGDKFNTRKVKEALQEQVKKFIEEDTSKWNQYCYKPSQFIKSLDSLFYAGNEEIMDDEIEYILSKRNKDGVWDIVWNWGEYPDEFSISRNWWKANIIIENLLLMKRFGKFRFATK